MNIFSIRDLEPAEDTELEVSQCPATIMVIGTGSGGSNAIDHMNESGLSGVQFIAVNTDKQHLYGMSKARTRLHIGSKLTGGRGAGGDPNKGEEAAREDHEMIRKTMKGADMVFLTTGMGGGTGTGSIPVIANIAKEAGCLTVAVVTMPFEDEGNEKMQIAVEGINKLREEVDTLIIIPNENLYKMIDSEMSFDQMLSYADDILLQAVRGISDLVTKPGKINCDFADVEATMKGQGVAHLGIGCGSGENRAKDAVEDAIENPLLEDISITGATRLLVNIAGPKNIPAVEVKEILGTIRAKAGMNAKMKFGITYDPDMGEDVKVTVIATGLKNIEIVSENEMSKHNNEMQNEEYVGYDIFQAMRGNQNNKQQNENYVNFFKNTEDFKTLREIPAISRKGNMGEFIYGDKILVNGRDA